MMLAPVNEKCAPHGGRWKYVQPGPPEKSFSEPTSKQLLIAVRKHREGMIAAGRSPDDYDLAPGWQARLMDHICRTQEGVNCEEVDQDGKAIRAWIGPTDVRRWWNTQKEWKAQGKPMVSQEEAERRALICQKCIHNKPVGGCDGCTGFAAEVASFLSGMTTPQDERLNVCLLCHCFLKAKVWLPLDVVDNHGVDFTRAPWCWQKGDA